MDIEEEYLGDDFLFDPNDLNDEQWDNLVDEVFNATQASFGENRFTTMTKQQKYTAWKLIKDHNNVSLSSDSLQSALTDFGSEDVSHSFNKIYYYI